MKSIIKYILYVIIGLFLTTPSIDAQKIVTKSVTAYIDGSLYWPLTFSTPTLNVGTLNLTNGIQSTTISIIANNTLSNATNAINLNRGLTSIYYIATSDMSITGYNNMVTNELSMILLTITNSQSTNITITLPNGTKTLDGSRSYIITNATEAVFDFKIQLGSTNCFFRGIFF